MTRQDKADFKAYCQGVTNAQLRNIRTKELMARRTAFAAIAQAELEKRGLT